MLHFCIRRLSARLGGNGLGRGPASSPPSREQLTAVAQRDLLMRSSSTGYGSPRRKPNGYSTSVEGDGLVMVTGSLPSGCSSPNSTLTKGCSETGWKP